jgi:hypothetical protein
VSNSSTCSFIIDLSSYPNVFALAEHVLRIMIAEEEERGNPSCIPQYQKSLQKLQELQAMGINPDLPVDFSEDEEPCIIARKSDGYYFDTSFSYDWKHGENLHGIIRVEENRMLDDAFAYRPHLDVIARYLPFENCPHEKEHGSLLVLLSGEEICPICDSAKLEAAKIASNPDQYRHPIPVKDISVRGKKYQVEISGTLDLTNQDITKITEIEGLESLTELQELNLDANQIIEIEGLKSLTNLKTLHLNGNQIGQIKGLETLVNLQVLDLGNNQIAKIEGLDRLIHLQRLLLNGNKIGKIESLNTRVNLKWLILSKNNISKIEGLESLSTLEYLNLGDNRITLIEGMESLVNLQRLELYGNNITNSEKLDSLPRLKRVRLQSKGPRI